MGGRICAAEVVHRVNNPAAKKLLRDRFTVASAKKGMRSNPSGEGHCADRSTGFWEVPCHPERREPLCSLVARIDHHPLIGHTQTGWTPANQSEGTRRSGLLHNSGCHFSASVVTAEKRRQPPELLLRPGFQMGGCGTERTRCAGPCKAGRTRALTLLASACPGPS